MNHGPGLIAVPGIPLFIGAKKTPPVVGGGGGATLIAAQANATSITTAVTGPASIIAGDVLVMSVFNDGPTLSAELIPAGFTLVTPSLVSGTRRHVFCYKKADGTEAGASITGGNNTKTEIILAVFRPDVAATTLTGGSVHAEAGAAAPASQLCAASGGAVPLIVFGSWNASGAIAARTMSIAKDAELTRNNNNFNYLGWKIYNSAPADITFSMADCGVNFLTSFYISAA